MTTMHKPWRLGAVLLLSLFLASCAAVAPAPKPKLVVVFVIDACRTGRWRATATSSAPTASTASSIAAPGSARPYHGHAFTVTAAGHATVLTGASPARTGIIGNEWRDPQTGAPAYCTGDTTATYLVGKTQPLDGTSPRNLLVETWATCCAAATRAPR
jgi:predicted AlkP superfamily pyrophosphatase or phosphodiesterase